MLLPGLLAGINNVATGAGFPGRHITKEIPDQRLGRWIGLRASGHIELTEHHQALAFVVLQERAVLKAEAAVHDRQEIPASRLLDQDRRHVSSIATSPHARDRNVAP